MLLSSSISKETFCCAAVNNDRQGNGLEENRNEAGGKKHQAGLLRTLTGEGKDRRKEIDCRWFLRVSEIGLRRRRDQHEKKS